MWRRTRGEQDYATFLSTVAMTKECKEQGDEEPVWLEEEEEEYGNDWQNQFARF